MLLSRDSVTLIEVVVQQITFSSYKKVLTPMRRRKHISIRAAHSKVFKGYVIHLN